MKLVSHRVMEKRGIHSPVPAVSIGLFLPQTDVNITLQSHLPFCSTSAPSFIVLALCLTAFALEAASAWCVLPLDPCVVVASL